MSKLIRRTHMYLALFLAPWMAIYALATMAMNHREFFRDYYGGGLQKWDVESEGEYVLPDGTGDAPRDIGAAILADHGWTGPFDATVNNAGQVSVYRGDPAITRRMTYDPLGQHLVVERMAFRMPVILSGLHHRHGYGSEHVASDIWAVSVDLVVAAMLVWGLSGLWMWWGIKSTRRWGVVCILISFGLFSFFLFAI